MPRRTRWGSDRGDAARSHLDIAGDPTVPVDMAAAKASPDRGLEVVERLRQRLGAKVAIRLDQAALDENGSRGIIYRGPGGRQSLIALGGKSANGYTGWMTSVATFMVAMPATSDEDVAIELALLNQRTPLGFWVYSPDTEGIWHMAVDNVGTFPASGTVAATSRLLFAVAAYSAGPALHDARSLASTFSGEVGEPGPDELELVATVSAHSNAEVTRIRDAGRRPSRWGQDADLEAAWEAISRQNCVASWGPFGLEAEFAHGESETAILRVDSNHADPLLGRGCLMWLILPYFMPADVAAGYALELNRHEAAYSMVGPSIGSWTVWPDTERPTIGYRSFLPNALYCRNELLRHVAGMSVRSRLVAHLLKPDEPPGDVAAILRARGTLSTC